MPVPTFTSAPQPTHSVDTTNWAIVSIPATAWTPAVRTIDAETVEEEAVADCFPGGFDEVAGDWAPVPIEQAHYEITAGSEYVYKLPTPYTGGAVASFTIQGIIHLPSTAGSNITFDSDHSIPALHDRIAFPSLGDGGWNVTENGRCARFYKQISLTYVETADGGPFRPPAGVSGDGTLEVVWGVDVPQDQRPKVYLTSVVAEVDRGATSYSFPSSTPGPNPTPTTSSRSGSNVESSSLPDAARPTRFQATAILATLVPAMLLSLVGLGASF